MKKLTLLLAISAFVAGNLFATTRTVSNHPNGGAQYATLATAYAASSNGDTLLLEGTDINYAHTSGSNPWSKNLTVIGIGFNPSKTLPKKSKIAGNSFLPFVLGTGGDNSTFYGIEFVYGVNYLNYPSNYSFYNCTFDNPFSGPAINFLFVNCIFKYETNNSTTSCISSVVSNCNFVSCVFNGILTLNHFGSITNLDHCLFLHNTSGNTLIYGDYLNIQNSIFLGAGHSQLASGNNINFSNNVFSLNVTLPPLGGSNTANSNLTGVNPNFIIFNSSNGLYSPQDDYHLQAGSPAIGAGINGSDIGPHGSASNFSETGEVLIAPIVRSLSTSVGAGNTLNINVNATKPNDN